MKETNDKLPETNTNIRLANLDDLKELMDMGAKFFENSPYAKLDTIDMEEVAATLRNLLFLQSMAKAVILVSTDKDDRAVGMFAAVSNKAMWSSTNMATEVCLWVEPEDRKSGVATKLIEGYEYWTRMVGGKIASLSSLTALDPDNKLSDFYEKSGYAKAEQGFVKKV